jgi:hypothetical protein
MILKSQTGVELWKTELMMSLSIQPGKTVKEHINISAKGGLGYYELKQCKPWFKQGCSKLLDERKQSQAAMITGSKSNKWILSEQCKL